MGGKPPKEKRKVLLTYTEALRLLKEWRPTDGSAKNAVEMMAEMYLSGDNDNPNDRTAEMWDVITTILSGQTARCRAEGGQVKEAWEDREREKAEQE